MHGNELYERIRDIIGSSKEKYNSISEKFQRVSYRFTRKKKKEKRKKKRTNKINIEIYNVYTMYICNLNVKYFSIRILIVLFVMQNVNVYIYANTYIR